MNPAKEIIRKEDMLMSDFEILSLNMMILGIIVPLIVALINAKK